MANIDSRVIIGKNGESCSSVLKAFFSLPQTYILNLLLDNERDGLHVINYLIFKTEWFQGLKKVDFLKEDQRPSTGNKGVQECGLVKEDEDSVIVPAVETV